VVTIKSNPTHQSRLKSMLVFLSSASCFICNAISPFWKACFSEKAQKTVNNYRGTNHW